MMIDVGKLILLLVFFFFLLQISKKWGNDRPALQFFSLRLLQGQKSLKLRLEQVKRPFLWAALFFFCLPFCNPVISMHTRAIRTLPPKKGIALYLLIDNSGSMAAPIDELSHREKSKIEIVKELAKKFIEARTNDLIGLVEFARKADLISPLTLDHEELLRRLKTVSVVQREEESGTAIGYAIFKTVNLIVSTKHFAERVHHRPATYSIDNQVIILLTDGLQGPNPLDKNDKFRFMRVEEALSYAQQNKIRVYFIGVVAPAEMTQFLQATKSVQENVKATNGGFFVASNPTVLRDIFTQIDVLEKSEFAPVVVAQEEKISLMPFCIAVGLIFLFLAIMIETRFARTIP